MSSKVKDPVFIIKLAAGGSDFNITDIFDIIPENAQPYQSFESLPKEIKDPILNELSPIERGVPPFGRITSKRALSPYIDKFHPLSVQIRSYLDVLKGKTVDIDKDVRSVLERFSQIDFLNKSKAADSINELDKLAQEIIQRDVKRGKITQETANKLLGIGQDPDAIFGDRLVYAMKSMTVDLANTAIANRNKVHLTAEEKQRILKEVADAKAAIPGERAAQDSLVRIMQDPIKGFSEFFSDPRISSWNKLAVLLGIPMALIGGIRFISSLFSRDSDISLGDLLLVLFGGAATLYGFGQLGIRFNNTNQNAASTGNQNQQAQQPQGQQPQQQQQQQNAAPQNPAGNPPANAQAMLMRPSPVMNPQLVAGMPGAFNAGHILQNPRFGPPVTFGNRLA